MDKGSVATRPLIQVEHLKKYFKLSGKRYLHAVDDVSFSIQCGETLGLVGESGCGKSTVGNLLLRLYKASAGKFWYRDTDVFHADKKTSMGLRKKIQIIFQDPYSALNPRKTIQSTLREPFRRHWIQVFWQSVETWGLHHRYLITIRMSWMAGCVRSWALHGPCR